MKFIVVFFGLALTGAQCSRDQPPIWRESSQDTEATKLGIYDGTDTTIEKHPYLVAVNVRETFYCAAAIVNEMWVVTTANCVLGLDPEDVKIVAASDDGYTGAYYKTQLLMIHPNYSYHTNPIDYQYACIQISGKFKWSSKMKPTRLPKRAAKPKTKMTVVGWGITKYEKDTKESNGVLMQGVMKWQSQKSCKKAVAAMGENWSERVACAYNKGKTTLCVNDWADPFVHKGVLYGMFVTGDKKTMCSSSAPPIILSDIYEVVDWIKETTGLRV